MLATLEAEETAAADSGAPALQADAGEPDVQAAPTLGGAARLSWVRAAEVAAGYLACLPPAMAEGRFDTSKLLRPVRLPSRIQVVQIAGSGWPPGACTHLLHSPVRVSAVLRWFCRHCAVWRSTALMVLRSYITGSRSLLLDRNVPNCTEQCVGPAGDNCNFIAWCSIFFEKGMPVSEGLRCRTFCSSRWQSSTRLWQH